MLQNSSIKVLGHFFTFGFRLGAIPFEWNPSTLQIHLTKSKWKLIQWYCIMMYTISYTSFIGVRLFQSICCLEQVYIQHFVFGGFAWICWIIVLLFHVNTVLYRHEVCFFINHFISANETFRRTLEPNFDQLKPGTSCGESVESTVEFVEEAEEEKAEGEEEPRDVIQLPNERHSSLISDLHKSWQALGSCGKLICVLSFLCGEFCIGMIFPPLTLRRQPTFLHSLFPFFQKCSWMYLIPWGLNEAFWTLPGAVIFLFYLFTIYTYVYSARGILTQLKNGFGPENGTITKQNFGILYRQLQFVNNSYNLAFQDLILPLVTSAFMAITMSCIFAICKLYETLGGPSFYILPLMAAMSIAMVFIMFPICFKLRIASLDVLDSWSHSISPNNALLQSSELSKSFLKSCQPLGIRIGPFCVIKQSTVLEYIALVANGTINLLLTFY